MKIREIIKWIWEFIVMIAKIKLAIFIFISCVIAWVLALIVIDEAGGDVATLGRGIKIAINFAFAYLVIVMADWFIKMWKNESSHKDEGAK